MGSLFRAHYTAVNPKTGKRVSRRSKKWYIQYKLPNGDWKREPAYTDKLASQALLTQRERESAREAVGIFDHFADSMTLPIADHAKAFQKHLADKGDGEHHVETTHNRLLFVFKHGEIKSVGDLTPSKVDAALFYLVNELKRSVSSRNHYLRAVKSFADWLVNERRAPDTRLAGMRLKSTDGFETFERRPLEPDEFTKVVAAAIAGPMFDELSGFDRAALYVTAAYTGYRRKELASLTPAAFTFGDDPKVAVVATRSKRKRAESIPLSPSTAATLEAWMQGRAPGVPLWPIGDKRTADMIRDDLEAAGISWRTGKIVVDFHSLRSTFVSTLARANISPKLVQMLARHSTMDLTMNVYAKLSPDERKAAVATMPDLAQNLAQQLAQKKFARVRGGARTDAQTVSGGPLQKPSKTREKPTKKPRKP